MGGLTPLEVGHDRKWQFAWYEQCSSSSCSEPHYTGALELAWHAVGRRSWSLAKHSAPPECLVGVLSSTEATRTQTLRELETRHRNFLLLERRAVDSEDASCLRRDMIFLDSDAVRLMFEFYARDKYAPTSIYGRNAVMVYHWTLPDNKIV